jgi:hypothetical protein
MLSLGHNIIPTIQSTQNKQNKYAYWLEHGDPELADSRIRPKWPAGFLKKPWDLLSLY